MILNRASNQAKQRFTIDFHFIIQHGNIAHFSNTNNYLQGYCIQFRELYKENQFDGSGTTIFDFNNEMKTSFRRTFINTSSSIVMTICRKIK